MNRLFVIIFPIILSILFFAFLPTQVHAQDVYHFTASNIAYDPNTSNLSFDISNVEHGPIPWNNNGGGMQIGITDNSTGRGGGATFYGGKQFSNLTPYCTATHCSVTLYHNPGEDPVTASADVVIYATGNAYNGIPVWGSQDFTFGCIEPSTNTSPQINSLTGATLFRGNPYLETGSYAANNTSATSWTAMVDYGDGVSGLQPLTLSGTDFSLSNLYSNVGTHTTTVCVVDDQNGVGKTTATITVNPSITVGAITTQPNPVHVNSTVSATATFTDGNNPRTHTAVWDWGDGTTSAGTVNETSGSVSGSHIYSADGSYSVTLTVSDNYDNSAQNSTSVTVPRQLASLAPATLYFSKGALNLLNRFNLKAEVYKDTTLVSSGVLNNVNPGTNATLETIPFNTFSSVDLPSGSILKIKVLACSASGLGTGTATLHYNAASVDSRFGINLGSGDIPLHLLANSALWISAGNSAQTVNGQSKCSTGYATLGTWTITL